MIVEAHDADFEALLAGKGPQDFKLPGGKFEDSLVLNMLRELAQTIRTQFTPAAWLVVEHGEVVGLCSLVRMPSDRAIDIGYGITQARQANGYATTAVEALISWAKDDDRVDFCRAETSIHNHRSQRVLEKAGFQRVGTRHDDEDGELICWNVSCAR